MCLAGGEPFSSISIASQWAVTPTTNWGVDGKTRNNSDPVNVHPCALHLLCSPPGESTMTPTFNQFSAALALSIAAVLPAKADSIFFEGTFAPEAPGATGTGSLTLRDKAKMQGYEGEACGECGNYTLVRNGTCMKCNTCGGTSGCS